MTFNTGDKVRITAVNLGEGWDEGEFDFLIGLEGKLTTPTQADLDAYREAITLLSLPEQDDSEDYIENFAGFVTIEGGEHDGFEWGVSKDEIELVVA